MWGQTQKLPSKITCLFEQAEHHNLPLGIVINRCAATAKARSVPVIVINTSKQNVWIWQSLLAAELFSTDQIDKIEHRTSLEGKEDTINIASSQVTPNTRVQSEQVEVSLSNITPPTSSNKPSFGPLHDEDLGFCEKIKHTIPMTLDKPVYVLHCTTPQQLQGEVHKCLDTWLWQGIIRPLQSPYTSQVVIVQKRTGEICLCIDYWKLNSITIRDTFPLPRIDKAL